MQYEITDFPFQILSKHALNAINKSELPVGNAQAPGLSRASLDQSFPAGSGIKKSSIDGLPDRYCRDLATRTGTGIDQAVELQACQCRVIGIMAMALYDHLAIPLEAEPLEGTQNIACSPGDSTRTIDILNAQQPLAALRARIQITADSSDQRPEMQRPGWRRSKAAAIADQIGLPHFVGPGDGG
jgi:hypothetical protein